MLGAAILLSLAAAAISQEAFFEKYSFTKTMSTCFGEDVYYDQLAKIGYAQRNCLQLPVSNLYRLDFSIYSQIGYPLHFGGLEGQYVPFPNYHPAQTGYSYGGLPHNYQNFYYRQKRQATESAAEVIEKPPSDLVGVQALPQENEITVEPFFDRYYLLDSVNKIMTALSNYTCTLHQLDIIDEYLNIRHNDVANSYINLPIDEAFKKDLIDGLYYCRDLSYCLPVDKTKSPLPLNLQRLLMAMKCEKETRINACFKEDLRKNVNEFDLSLFPEDESEEAKLNKLSAIVMGVDSLQELEIL